VFVGVPAPAGTLAARLRTPVVWSVRCPTNSAGVECNGRGRCVSMKEAAAEADYVNFFYNSKYTQWDADMIFGCACDEGYTGYDCSQK
jgi:hypothetical protein